jgi:hypothetical protein
VKEKKNNFLPKQNSHLPIPTPTNRPSFPHNLRHITRLLCALCALGHVWSDSSSSSIVVVFVVIIIDKTNPKQMENQPKERRIVFKCKHFFYSHGLLRIGAKGFMANYPRTSILKQFEYLTIETCTKVDKMT